MLIETRLKEMLKNCCDASNRPESFCRENCEFYKFRNNETCMDEMMQTAYQLASVLESKRKKDIKKGTW